MYDIVIIGSGPAGLSSAIYAQRAGLKAVVIEKNYLGTGQIAESERVDNYPGLYGENGFDLGEKFRSHAESLGAEFVEGEVTEIIPNNNDYSIKLDNGNTIDTHTVIYAVGTERRKLMVEGEKEFSGRGVSYCAVCDAAFYKDKVTAVAGGGDTALGDAALLSKFAKKVYLIHRRDKFRANKTLQQKVESIPNVEILLDSQITKISGANKVESISVLQNGNANEIKVDGVFVAVGSVPNSALLKDLADIDSNGYVIADEDGITSAKGIFVAGDVRTKKLRQVVTAVSDGANCVLSAENYLENK
ncbi:NAD(P)/FAD-dependent oxidoreductase [Ruminococcus sp.]|uniref:NAD(P)/FAD-dependent oxidoreductase n=1 Tax=Ruminococcus sp. TaxID=41978 RepID=UPI00386D7F6B